MAQNEGKKFEEDIQNSIPENWWCYRLKDSSGSWSKTDKSRFTPKNMCDFIIFNTEKGYNYGIECKSFKGKSMPYGNLNDVKGKKLDALCDMSSKKNCCGGFILNFRDLNETYWIEAVVLNAIKENSDRKSLSLGEVELYGKYIPQKLKRVRYSYDFTRIL